jgi:Flp pilus assembly protein TadG
MQRKAKTGFWSSDSAATAALYALALPALVAVAGLGFDYARIASMDSELQNAADQAALAGATQLDQSAGSMQRAVNAARGGLVSNSTLFANDGAGTTVTVPDTDVYFYETRADAEAGTNPLDRTDTTTNDAKARYIRVAVATRTADYALTSVVGAFSGDIDAEAVAGIGAALCRTPPLMICNPTEPSNNMNTELAFDPDTLRGFGLLAKGGGGSFWAPGNFGYLDTVPGSGGGTPDLRKALGWDSPPGECISQSANDAVDTSTGNKTDIADSLNTRFDIYNGSTACPTGGSCSASFNSVKDVTHPDSLTGGQACKLGNSGWQEAAGTKYLPGNNNALPVTVTPASMGHPRDICHATATNTCTGAGAIPGAGPIGDGFWDRDAYFRTHYRRSDPAAPYWNNSDWQSNTGLSQSTGPRPRYPTRFDVYEWEIAEAQKNSIIDGVAILGGPSSAFAYGKPKCSAGAGYGTGTVPSEFVADRRRLSVAVINCVAHRVRGNSTAVPVREFMDVFLVQPSLNRDRTQKDEIYVEIIGRTKSGSAGETAGTVIRRDVPYLIR